jgi:hypothetical protein
MLGCTSCPQQLQHGQCCSCKFLQVLQARPCAMRRTPVPAHHSCSRLLA